MQVKNEYVKIKSGEKEYTLKNYIYDSYLKLFSEQQINTYEMIATIEDVYTSFSSCYIKVDTPLEEYKNAKMEEFDIRIPLKNYEISGNEKGTSTIYNFTSFLPNAFENIDLTPYNGKKITAIGFGSAKSYSSITLDTIYACIDTSYYSIYVDSSKGIDITRKDIISSNAVCEGIDYPLHLAPVLERTSEPDDTYKGAVGRIRPILYSVGFGIKRGEMKEEFVIGEDAEIQTIDDMSYGVIMKNPVTVALYPSNNLYPEAVLCPRQPEHKEVIYPQEKNIYPSDSLYPLESGYNFIIFKYRLYYNVLNDIIYLDEYYTMSYAHSPKGIFTIKNSIERG